MEQAFADVGWKVTLLESLNKRCVFLEHVVGLIGLANVMVIRGRAEVCLLPNPSTIYALFRVNHMFSYRIYLFVFCKLCYL